MTRRLVITAALRRGLTGGLLVALAPFVTDAPIIALSLLLLDRLPPWALTSGFSLNIELPPLPRLLVALLLI